MSSWAIFCAVILALGVWGLYMERLERLRQIERERRLRIEAEIQMELVRLEERSRTRRQRWSA